MSRKKRSSCLPHGVTDEVRDTLSFVQSMCIQPCRSGSLSGGQCEAAPAPTLSTTHKATQSGQSHKYCILVLILTKYM